MFLWLFFALSESQITFVGQNRIESTDVIIMETCIYNLDLIFDTGAITIRYDVSHKLLIVSKTTIANVKGNEKVAFDLDSKLQLQFRIVCVTECEAKTGRGAVLDHFISISKNSLTNGMDCVNKFAHFTASKNVGAEYIFGIRFSEVVQNVWFSGCNFSMNQCKGGASSHPGIFYMRAFYYTDITYCDFYRNSYANGLIYFHDSINDNDPIRTDMIVYVNFIQNYDQYKTLIYTVDCRPITMKKCSFIDNTCCNNHIYRSENALIIMKDIISDKYIELSDTNSFNYGHLTWTYFTEKCFHLSSLLE